jgi:RNA polymerase sigma-70 factor (ECF subfamily)
VERLLRANQAGVYSVCLRITGNRDDAADAAQNALIGIVRGLANFDGRSRVSTWAYRIAANAALDEVRRRNRRPLAEPVTDDLEDRAASVDSTADRLDIDDALARLPIDFRAAVVLRDLCGLDYAEIATTLGIPPGTVRSRIARGRAALVPMLAGNPEAARVRPRTRS